MFKLFRTIFIPAKLKSNIYSFNICNVMHVYLGKEHKCNPYFVVFQMVCSAFIHSVCLLITVQHNSVERPLCFFFFFNFDFRVTAMRLVLTKHLITICFASVVGERS